MKRADVMDPRPPVREEGTSFLRFVFTDVDELRTLNWDWDLQYEQLEPGKLWGEVSVFLSGSIEIFRESYSRGIFLRGTVKRDRVVFGLMLRPNANVRWCGHRPEPSNLFAFDGDSEMLLRSLSALDFLGFCIPKEMLFSYADGVHELDLEAELRGRHILSGNGTATEVLRRNLIRIAETAENHPERMTTEAVQKTLEEELLEGLFQAIQNNTQPSRKERTNGRRRNIVVRAIDCIRAHEWEALTVGDLCRAVGVSERTLQYSFQEILRISPQRYVRLHRLNAARRHLRDAHADATSVTDIACQWGFFHLGRFSVQYKEMFGESPSETLRRSPSME